LKVLVTGGTGYIGSHVVAALHEAGEKVIIIDDLSRSTASTLNNLKKIMGFKPEFHKVDLSHRSALFHFFNDKKEEIKAVIHCAAYKSVRESVENPFLYYRNNVKGMSNLLEAMYSYDVDNLVFSSSCTVYGESKTLPVNEKTELQITNSPYGTSKLMSEQMMRDICMHKPFNAISLRYFNPIGAHKSNHIGESILSSFDNLIPYITQTAIGKINHLNVYGNDYNTPDGTCIRDYIHIEDLAEAHVLAIKRLVDKNNKTNFELFNLGTGIGYSVLDVINTFQEVNRIKVNYKITKRREGDVEAIYADASLAEKELKWKAKRDLKQMLKSAWNWQKKIILDE
jgi:UDP-glucose 4-epimerase